MEAQLGRAAEQLEGGAMSVSKELCDQYTVLFTSAQKAFGHAADFKFVLKIVSFANGGA